MGNTFSKSVWACPRATNGSFTKSTFAHLCGGRAVTGSASLRFFLAITVKDHSPKKNQALHIPHARLQKRLLYFIRYMNR